MNKIFYKFNLAMNIYISLIINIVLCIVLVYIATGSLSPGPVLGGFAIAFPVSTFLVLFIPVNRFGDFVAAQLGAKAFSMPAVLISTAVLALILATFMSMLMVAIMAGRFVGVFTAAYFDHWLTCYPWALISVYLSALFGRFTGLPLAVKLCGAPDTDNQ